MIKEIILLCMAIAATYALPATPENSDSLDYAPLVYPQGSFPAQREAVSVEQGDSDLEPAASAHYGYGGWGHGGWGHSGWGGGWGGYRGGWGGYRGGWGYGGGWGHRGHWG